MKRVLITGATGFVGFHLVKQLAESGCEIWCIVRKSSNRSLISPFKPVFIEGDITDPDSVVSVLSETRFDAVFHLAAVTMSTDASDFYHGNETGTKNVANACALCPTPPVLVLLSSLAARGPDQTALHQPDQPVSVYGKSKLAGEQAAKSVSDSVPVSIIRAPIVFGEADYDSVATYAAVQNYGIHVVPCVTDNHYSLIYAGDLAIACELIAKQGRRITQEMGSTTGIYYPALQQTYTFAQFGQAIASAMGKKKPVIVRVPAVIIWVIATMAEAVAKISGTNSLINRDKAREVTGGSWTSQDLLLQKETGFATRTTIQQGLLQTINWYRDIGWLKRR